MEKLKVVLWDSSWDAKSWYGGQEQCAPSTPCWEYAAAACDLDHWAISDVPADSD